MRPRPAPRAARTAISLLRPTALASSMLARFAHAISSTTPTAASITQSVSWKLPTMSSRIRATATLSFVLLSGYFASRRAPIAAICACACSKVTPGFSFPTTR